MTSESLITSYIVKCKHFFLLVFYIFQICVIIDRLLVISFMIF